MDNKEFYTMSFFDQIEETPTLTATATQCDLVMETGETYKEKRKLSDPGSIVEFAKDFCNTFNYYFKGKAEIEEEQKRAKQGFFLILAFDVKLHLISCKMQEIDDKVITEMTEFLLLNNAASFATVVIRKSGRQIVNDSDLKHTKEIKEMSKIFDLNFIDYIAIDTKFTDEFISLAEEGEI